MKKTQVFISYSGHDAFEASLLQFAIENILSHERVSAWTFQRDQQRSEKEIAAALKKSVKESVATVFIVSPSTLDGGAAQWVELGYCDAFDVKTFVLLHHLDYNELKSYQRGVPPLLLASQCNAAQQWKAVVGDIKSIVEELRGIANGGTLR